VVAQASDAHSAALIVEPRGENLLAVKFLAMASPCEVLLPSMAQEAALAIGAIAADEALRVEKKFSRYRSDSVTARIHEHRGAPIEVDEETAALIDFASQCHDLSDGLFDITSGVLRRAWRFDGSDRIPEPEAVDRLLPLVGFDKLHWQPPRLTLPAGMELDFGGIGKEYAVDRAFELLAARHAAPFLVNFGGDLRANRPPAHGSWQVGIERPDAERESTLLLNLERGALATSGDSRRFLLKDGIRYGHILDPRTGWPVPGAPRSVTVAAGSCTEAGLLSTLALLHGSRAQGFLEDQGVRYWILQ
jgi:thiamine biosynthesis lipoprotein